MSGRNAIDPTGIFDGHAEALRYEQPEADKRLATSLKEWRESAAQARTTVERGWDLYFSYLRGEQLLGRHKVTGEIIKLSAEDSKRLRSSNNILRPISRSLVGKLSKLIPTYTVVPASADFEEQHGSLAADAILQYFREKEDLDLLYSKLCGYLPWAGNSFAQLCWDPLGGRTLAFCDTCKFFDYSEELVGEACPQCSDQRQQEEMAQQAYEQQQMAPPPQEGDFQDPSADPASSEMGDPNGFPSEDPSQPPQESFSAPPVPPPEPLGPLPPGAEIPPLVEAREGDVRAYLRDVHDVFLPVGCTDIKYARKFCVQQVMEISEARQHYPMMALFIKPSDNIAVDRTARFKSNNFSMNDSSDMKDHVVVEEYHEASTEMYPHGRMMVMINDIIVEEKESPYFKLGRPNLYHFGFDPVEGELYREPYIAQAWHRQRELNLLETQLREGIDLGLRPKVLNPIGTQIEQDEFTSLSGQVVNYFNGVGKPEWQIGPEVPQGAWTRKADLTADVRSMAGVTESEQGIMGSDPNGRAAAIINAEADQQVGPIVARNNSEWKELHKGVLILYQQYAHPDRLATIVGPQGVQTYSFSDLNLLKTGWDLRAEQEDSLSRNPTVRLTQAMDLANVGLFMDPATGTLDKKMFARYAKLSLAGSGYDTEATERAAASSIPYQIAQGIPWQPRSFDDPMIFAEVLIGWLRGPGRSADPQLSQQMEQIWMYYVEWAQTQQMPQGGGMMGQEQGASQPGSDQSAPGGTANNPGHLGSDVASEAQAAVSEADSYGEGMATDAAG
jgi:hypothetical protein